VTHVGHITTYAWTYQHWVTPYFSTAPGSVVWSLVFVGACATVSVALYLRGVLIRV